MTTFINSLLNILAREYSTPEKTVNRIIALFEEGATVPFIARYRKEVTGGMSDETLRTFHQRWQYLVELEKRRSAIIEYLKALPDIPQAVFKAVETASTKRALEDLYAPFKKTRKTKSDAAIELGLLAFTVAWWRDGESSVQAHYQRTRTQFKQPLTLSEAKAGAADIIVERLSQNIQTLQQGKLFLQKEGELVSKVMRGKKDAGEKFRDYFDYRELVKKCPPHRLLALFRGKKDGILKLSIEAGEALPQSLNRVAFITPFGFPECKDRSPSKDKIFWLEKAWNEKIQSKLETDILSELKEKAENSAIDVFQSNLKDLLMAAPAGAKRTLALDPGFRNGVKWAAVDEHGQLLKHGVVYPHAPQNRDAEAQSTLAQVITAQRVEWVVIGNGTASRETQVMVEKMIQNLSLSCRSAIVSEAGASVYSASAVAIEEFPDLDVTIRGAVSIARRFQDPLAELVKIDPQAIGVGQYQHDVKTNRLGEALGVVVEDCVNAVGVDLNLASVSLLTYVSGLTQRMAQNIVAFREQVGGFKRRAQLKSVKGIGDKAFEQCAGFLRIRGGDEPLDASAVHPESYGVIKALAKSVQLEMGAIVGNAANIARLQSAPAAAEQGAYTFQDILQELSKPGRDPRPAFEYAHFDDTVNCIEDVQEGMILEGVVTNVAAFGAFVDLGVHQDGLIHISQLADRFVKDPRDEVRVGEVVKVQVIEVDVARKRIALKRLR